MLGTFNNIYYIVYGGCYSPHHEYYENLRPGIVITELNETRPRYICLYQRKMSIKLLFISFLLKFFQCCICTPYIFSTHALKISDMKDNSRMKTSGYESMTNIFRNKIYNLGDTRIDMSTSVRFYLRLSTHEKI